MPPSDCSDNAAELKARADALFASMTPEQRIRWIETGEGWPRSDKATCICAHRFGHFSHCPAKVEDRPSEATLRQVLERFADELAALSLQGDDHKKRQGMLDDVEVALGHAPVSAEDPPCGYDLNELDRIAQAASPGPWAAREKGVVQVSSSALVCSGPDMGPRNARFIAAARQAMPLLIRDIWRLRDQVHDLQEDAQRRERAIPCSRCNGSGGEP